MKKCIRCDISKSLCEYYKDIRTKDGHMNTCKECKRIKNRIRLKSTKYKAYLAKNREHINQKQREWNKKNSDKLQTYRQKSYENNPEKHKLFSQKWAKNNPEKRKCHETVARAIRCGKLNRMPCVYCGHIKSQAHHPNYLKPLDVIWLCAQCHKDEHKHLNNNKMVQNG